LAQFPTCRKILLSSAWWPPLAKTGKEATFNIYGGQVNMIEGPIF